MQQQQHGEGPSLRISVEQGTGVALSIQQQLVDARLHASELQSSNSRLQQQLSELRANNGQLQTVSPQLQQQPLLGTGCAPQLASTTGCSFAETAPFGAVESSPVTKLQNELQTARSQLTDLGTKVVQLQSKMTAMQTLPAASHDVWVSAGSSGLLLRINI